MEFTNPLEKTSLMGCQSSSGHPCFIEPCQGSVRKYCLVTLWTSEQRCREVTRDNAHLPFGISWFSSYLLASKSMFILLSKEPPSPGGLPGVHHSLLKETLFNYPSLGLCPSRLQGLCPLGLHILDSPGNLHSSPVF